MRHVCTNMPCTTASLMGHATNIEGKVFGSRGSHRIRWTPATRATSHQLMSLWWKNSTQRTYFLPMRATDRCEVLWSVPSWLILKYASLTQKLKNGQAVPTPCCSILYGLSGWQNPADQPCAGHGPRKRTRGRLWQRPSWWAVPGWGWSTEEVEKNGRGRCWWAKITYSWCWCNEAASKDDYSNSISSLQNEYTDIP